MPGEVQRYEFVHIDGGGAAPNVPAGAAGRGGAPGGPGRLPEFDETQPGRRGGGRRPDDHPARRPDDPRKFGQDILDALKQASALGLFGRAVGAGAALALPAIGAVRFGRSLLDWIQGIEPMQLAGGRAGGRGAGGLGPAGGTIARATFQGPAQAVFMVPASAQMIFQGGPGLLPGGRGGGPVGPSGSFGGGGPPRGPIVAGGPVSGLPAVPGGRAGLPVPAGAGVPAVAGQAGVPAIAFLQTTRLGQAAASAAPALGAVAGSALALAPVIGALVIAIGAAILAIRAIINRARRQSEELSAFDAGLARAQARAQVAVLQQQIRSARTGGAELARFTEATTRMQIAMTRILDVLQRDVLRILNPILEFIASGMETVADIYEELTAIRDGIIEWATGNRGWTELLDVIAENLAKIDKNTSPAAGDFFNLFLGLADLDLNDFQHFQKPRTAGGAPIAAAGFGPLPMP